MNEDEKNVAAEQAPETTQELVEEVVKQEVKFRHPHQILTNKEIQILIAKKEEDLTEVEKDAIKLFIVRTKHHGSSPRKVLNTAQNKKKRNKKRIAKQSRKANR